DMGGMMRVSVVATGIDAMDVNTETPVPRRSMSTPLKQSVAAENPIAVEETMEVAETKIAEAAEEPSLFRAAEVERAAPQPAAQEASARQTPEADDVPAPAYQPQVAAFEPKNDEIEAEADVFVAPRAPAPGTPSPEALARLRAAAQKAAPRTVPSQQQPQGDPQQAASAAHGERPRFGINSLINRMTGHGENTGERSAQPPARQQPPVQHRAAAPAPHPEEAVDPDQERIEIPAFLRRQAN
ncbi:MAG: cell division protein FtsZ, partial [Sulfitobacter sp.]